jgi:hypothetical protein
VDVDELTTLKKHGSNGGPDVVIRRHDGDWLFATTATKG